MGKNLEITSGTRSKAGGEHRNIRDKRVWHRPEWQLLSEFSQNHHILDVYFRITLFLHLREHRISLLHFWYLFKKKKKENWRKQLDWQRKRTRTRCELSLASEMSIKSQWTHFCTQILTSGRTAIYYTLLLNSLEELHFTYWKLLLK